MVYSALFNTVIAALNLVSEKYLTEIQLSSNITQLLSIPHTVKKQRNLNLRFSSMSHIESKIVHVRAENIIMLYEWKVYVKFEDFCFTSDDAEDYARSEIRRKACISSHNLDRLVCVSVAHW
jgi:hypothetical protein